MNTFIWACLIGSFALIISAAPPISRPRTPTWFDLMPYLAASKKGSGRLQQTSAHRKRKTRR
jgi:hypothetical protein